MMKYKITAIVSAIILCVLIPLSVYASSSDFSVKIPKSFKAGYTDGDLSDVSNIIGTKKENLKKQCEENNVLMIAVNKDNSVQIRISRYQTDLSKEVKNLSQLSEKQIASLSSELKENGYEKTALGGTVYLKFSENLTDSGGNYESTNYITVKNGYVYQLSAYYSENAEREESENLINSFKIHEKTVYSSKQKTVIAAAIAVFAALIGFMIFGIIKDIYLKDGEE